METNRTETASNNREETVCLIESQESSEYTELKYKEDQTVLNTLCHEELFTNTGVQDLDQKARFVVGERREIFVGDRKRMAAVSPIFEAMFRQPWIEERDIEIPDVLPEAFKVLLRFSEDKGSVKLTESNVWDVLKAADKYHVMPIVGQCFSFLLHEHPCRHSGLHLSAVLEMAHQLNHEQEYNKCLTSVLKQGRRVLKQKSSLTQLCYHCLLNIIKADDLTGVDETSVYQAVMTWTKFQCSRQNKKPEPSSEELRATAGELLYCVRYLTIPEPNLKQLLTGQRTACPLTRDEVDNLLHGQGSEFLPSVKEARHNKKAPRQDREHTNPTADASRRQRRKCLYWSIIVVMLLLVMFVVQYVVAKFLIGPMAKIFHLNFRCRNETLCQIN